MLRLWRQYLNYIGRKLAAQNGAKTTPNKRGNYITTQTYDSLEIQCHAAIQHQLALYLHSSPDGHNYAVPKNASTIATERFIGQSQAKTSHLQSLNQEPSVAETIDRAGKIQHNIETLHQLAVKNVQTSATSNRKKTISKFTSHKSHSSYRYPIEYNEFITELKTAFHAGVLQAQKEMEKLPSEFKEVLVKNNLWDKPMTFLYENVKVVQTIPSYNRIDIPVSLNEEKPVDVVEETDIEPEKFIESNVTEAMDDSFDYSDEDIIEAAQEVSADKSLGKLYITRGTTELHISKALKLAIGGRDIVSKERGKRHWAPSFLPNLQPIPIDHDVILFRHYAIKQKKSAEIVQITSLETNDGQHIRSTTISSKSRFRAIYFFHSNFHEIIKPNCTSITPWISVRQIIGEVILDKQSNGSIIMASESKKMLQEAGYNNESSVSLPIEEETSLPEGYFEVENIVQKRINSKTHETEFLVKFKGYDDKHNEWLSSSTFLGPVSFTSTSRYGRSRSHVTNMEIDDAQRCENRNKKTGPAKVKRRRETDAKSPESPISYRKKSRILRIPSSSSSQSSNDEDDCQNIKLLSKCGMNDTSLDATIAFARDVTSPWGGSTSSIQLVNTCTIDGILSMFAIAQSQNCIFRTELKRLASEQDYVSTCVLKVLELAQEGKWNEARIYWMTKVVNKQATNGILDCEGDEQDSIVLVLQQSKLCLSAARKNTMCLGDTACKHMSKRVTSIEMHKLLGRWSRDEPDSMKMVQNLPLENILNRAYSSDGCPGVCNHCQMQAIVSFSVPLLPPVLIFWLGPFVRENPRFNKPELVPNMITIRRDTECIRYTLMGVSIFRPGHYRAVLNINSHMLDYNPARYQQEKLKVHKKLDADETLQVAVFVKL